MRLRLFFFCLTQSKEGGRERKGDEVESLLVPQAREWLEVREAKLRELPRVLLQAEAAEEGEHLAKLLK